MDNYISTIFNWSYKIWSCEGTVNNKRNLMCVCNFCNFFNIGNLRIWISKYFYVKSLCILLNGSFKVLRIQWINEGCCYSEIYDCMCKVIISSSINILCCYNVISCKGKILNHIGNSCCTGSYGQGCNATFKLCNSSLKNILCRIGKSSINITCITKSETVCRML